MRLKAPAKDLLFWSAKWAAAGVCVILLGVIVSIALPISEPVGAESVDEESVGAAIADEINDERRERGFQPYRYSERLDATATAYSREMVEYDFYSHTSPKSGGIEQRIPCDSPAENLNSALYAVTISQDSNRLRPADSPLVEQGYTGEFRIENQTELAEYIVAKWMASENHKRNILWTEGVRQGIGVAVEDRERGKRVVVTQQIC